MSAAFLPCTSYNLANRLFLPPQQSLRTSSWTRPSSSTTRRHSRTGSRACPAERLPAHPGALRRPPHHDPFRGAFGGPFTRQSLFSSFVCRQSRLSSFATAQEQHNNLFFFFSFFSRGRLENKLRKYRTRSNVWPKLLSKTCVKV